jgi:hypothetical protein
MKVYLALSVLYLNLMFCDDIHCFMKVIWSEHIIYLKIHMHKIFIVFLKLFQSLIDTKPNTANIFKNILKILPDIRSFRSLPIFAESTKHGWALLPKAQS